MHILILSDTIEIKIYLWDCNCFKRKIMMFVRFILSALVYWRYIFHIPHILLLFLLRVTWLFPPWCQFMLLYIVFYAIQSFIGIFFSSSYFKLNLLDKIRNSSNKHFFSRSLWDVLYYLPEATSDTLIIFTEFLGLKSYKHIDEIHIAYVESIS